MCKRFFWFLRYSFDTFKFVNLYSSYFRILLVCIGKLCESEVIFYEFGYKDHNIYGNIFVTNNETKDELLQSIRDELLSSDVFSENVTSLEIGNKERNTKINRIPSELFAILPKLRKLQTDLQITEITSGDLENARELAQLFLSDSKLFHLTAGTFPPMKLQRLELKSNEIEIIDDFVFANLSQLNFLYLAKNKLPVIRQFTFGKAYKLEKLHLEKNEIHTIENGAFADSKELIVLYLDQNKLQTINEHWFDGLEKLSTLSICGNQIKSIGDHLYSLNSLDYLNLDENSIGDIDLVKLSKLPNLTYLSLRKTELDLENYYVSTEGITFNSSLKNLNLGFNSITSAKSLEVLRIFPNLEELNLKGNTKLNKLNKHELRKFLPKLETLRYVQDF